MAEPSHMDDDVIAPEEPAQLRDLLPFAIADRLFAVFTDQVDATAEAKPFARLPRSPRAIAGVVCVRGRMLTVLDSAAALNETLRDWEHTVPYVLVLRGDEQLALAADVCRDTITVSAEDIAPPPEDSAGRAAIGIVRYAGEEILILDASRLFECAVQRRERRRRRF